MRPWRVDVTTHAAQRFAERLPRLGASIDGARDYLRVFVERDARRVPVDDHYRSVHRCDPGRKLTAVYTDGRVVAAAVETKSMILILTVFPYRDSWLERAEATA